MHPLINCSSDLQPSDESNLHSDIMLQCQHKLKHTSYSLISVQVAEDKDMGFVSEKVALFNS